MTQFDKVVGQSVPWRRNTRKWWHCLKKTSIFCAGVWRVRCDNVPAAEAKIGNCILVAWNSWLFFRPGICVRSQIHRYLLDNISFPPGARADAAYSAHAEGARLRETKWSMPGLMAAVVSFDLA